MESDKPAGAAFWRSFAMFEGFSGEAIARLAGIAATRKWRAGEVIFQRGDTGDSLIAVRQGRIKLSLLTASGKELALRHAEAGTILGEMAILDDLPRSADATASTAVEGFLVSRSDFARLLANHADAADSVIRYLCTRLRETTDQLESIALYELDARVARFFLANLRQIHGEDLPDQAQLALPLNQGEIAAILGASRPKVNRAILSLEESGAIARQGAVIACDIGRLLALAEPEDS